jgi:3-methyl-2-oxobutanoate hydroxymethyltransferase
MLGFYEGRSPRFVKRYAELGEAVVEALERYAEEVRSSGFPEEKHTYGMPEEEQAAFEGGSVERPVVPGEIGRDHEQHR